jgi:hypothetical protein
MSSSFLLIFIRASRKGRWENFNLDYYTRGWAGRGTWGKARSCSVIASGDLEKVADLKKIFVLIFVESSSSHVRQMQFCILGTSPSFLPSVRYGENNYCAGIVLAMDLLSSLE